MSRLHCFLIAVVSIVMTGCATVGPRAQILNTDETARFFTAAPDGKASIFFVCGSWKTESWLMSSNVLLPHCAVQINGKAYKTLIKNNVGRVDVEPGLLNLLPVEEDPLAVYIPLKISVNAGDSILITQNLKHKLGPLGGALSGSFIHSLDWTNENVLNKIKSRQPVNMVD
jgi:hypothetical protein